MDFNNIQDEKLRGLLESLYEVAAAPAEQRKATRNFHTILVNLTEIFPEEKRAIFDVLGSAVIESSVQPSSSTGVVSRKDVFSGVKTKLEQPCADCPDAIRREVESKRFINDQHQLRLPAELLSEQPQELTELRLPADLLPADEVPPPAVLEFKDVQTREQLDEFLAVKHRDPQDVILDVKGWLSAFKVDYSPRIRSVKGFVDVLFHEVIESRHLEDLGIDVKD